MQWLWQDDGTFVLNNDFVFVVEHPLWTRRMRVDGGLIRVRKLTQKTRARIVRAAVVLQTKAPRVDLDSVYCEALRADGVPSWRVAISRGMRYIGGVLRYQWRYF